MTQNIDTTNPDAIKDLCLEAIDDGKGKKPIAINVEAQSDIMSWLLVASGTSTKHIEHVANTVASVAREQGIPTLGKEGDSGSDWVLVDLGDVVVNVMMPDARKNYDLERLWSDGEIVAPGPNE